MPQRLPRCIVDCDLQSSRKTLSMNLRSIKHTFAACLFGIASLGSAHAATLTEDFEAPFPAWESDWFGTLSDAANYYCAGASGCNDRGNNPDGLWLLGVGGAASGPITVTFNADFGASLTSFKLDVAGFVPTRLTAVDSDGAVVFDEDVTLTNGAFSDPGVYASYTITSTTGIASFTFSGGVAGNTSIDNLVATTAPIPEPASVALMLAGLAAVGAAARRKSYTRR